MLESYPINPNTYYQHIQLNQSQYHPNSDLQTTNNEKPISDGHNSPNIKLENEKGMDCHKYRTTKLYMFL